MTRQQPSFGLSPAAQPCKRHPVVVFEVRRPWDNCARLRNDLIPTFLFEEVFDPAGTAGGWQFPE
jgi:hypothetical protein